MHYVGRARREQDAGRVHAAAGLFLEGTEFLHSVRYLDIAGDGTAAPSERMKELRYSRKEPREHHSALRKMELAEGTEAALSQDPPEQYPGNEHCRIARRAEEHRDGQECVRKWEDQW